MEVDKNSIALLAFRCLKAEKVAHHLLTLVVALVYNFTLFKFYENFVDFGWGNLTEVLKNGLWNLLKVFRIG